jgi:DNA-3-methyladenine glycosylase I
LKPRVFSNCGDLRCLARDGATGAADDPLYVAYHDTEWGVPERDGRALWENSSSTGFQAGLAWITILRKRDAFREAFDGFDPEVIAALGRGGCARLADRSGHRAPPRQDRGHDRQCPGLSRDRTAGGGFAVRLELRGRGAVQNRFASQADVPAIDRVERAAVQGPAKAGFRFCGPTIVYAWMEATGW